MKFGNQPITIDGKSFSSKLEGGRWAELRLLERAGEIQHLQSQVTFRIEIGGELICKYIADFVYTDRNGKQVVEDTKSLATMTPVYRLKKKLMRVVNGIDIVEVLGNGKKAKRRLKNG